MQESSVITFYFNYLIRQDEEMILEMPFFWGDNVRELTYIKVFRAFTLVFKTIAKDQKVKHIFSS